MERGHGWLVNGDRRMGMPGMTPGMTRGFGLFGGLVGSWLASTTRTRRLEVAGPPRCVACACLAAPRIFAGSLAPRFCDTGGSVMGCRVGFPFVPAETTFPWAARCSASPCMAKLRIASMRAGVIPDAAAVADGVCVCVCGGVFGCVGGIEGAGCVIRCCCCCCCCCCRGATAKTDFLSLMVISTPASGAPQNTLMSWWSMGMLTKRSSDGSALAMLDRAFWMHAMYLYITGDVTTMLTVRPATSG